MTLITFDTIAGARIYYPPNGLKPRKVRLEQAFFGKLEACLNDLWQRCPWGAAEWLGSLGCYVVDPKRDTGRHKTGEAIDISGIRWNAPGGPTLHVTSNDPEAALGMGAPPLDEAGGELLPRYLAVEAVFRLHFQTVLNWWHPDGDGKYRHRDHWHIDTGRGEPTWEGRRNQVRFLQAALRYVWEEEGRRGPLDIDGAMGSETTLALNDTGALLQSSDWWPLFLEETARKGFAG